MLLQVFLNSITEIPGKATAWFFQYDCTTFFGKTFTLHFHILYNNAKCSNGLEYIGNSIFISKGCLKLFMKNSYMATAWKQTLQNSPVSRPTSEFHIFFRLINSEASGTALAPNMLFNITMSDLRWSKGFWFGARLNLF